MEIGAAIVAALVAGATAAAHDTASQTVKDIYAGLKGLLAGRLSSLTTLEIDPSDEDFQKAAAKELAKKQLTADEQILVKARELLAAAAAAPPEQLATAEIDLQRLKAASDVIVKDIASHGSFVAQDITSEAGRIEIAGIRIGGDEPLKN